MSDILVESDQIDHDISPIKKERIKKQKKEILRQRLRDSLPVLSKKEIRKFRLPYHEALLADLKENGFDNTADFIKQLIDLQDKTRKRYGPGTVMFMRPQLKESKENLDLLSQNLSSAEAAHQSNQFAKEGDDMLRLAAYYAFGSDDWWWLGEQLLFQCVSMENQGDYNKQEAISYFLMGKYLVENGKKMEGGRNYLDIARDMSKGKSWNCTKYLNKKQDILFIESCRLLFTTLMEESLILMKVDPRKAIEVCNVARKRAAESCDHENEYEALLLKGRCELLIGESTNAIGTLTKALNRTVRKKTIKGICESKIALALAYLQRGKTTECYECLKTLKQLAEENDLPFYVAQAYRFMGEYFLSQKQPYEATPLLILGFHSFHQQKDLHRREKVRTWAALSAGEELFPAFIKLIMSCDDPETGNENLIKLVRWIDEKKFFWTQLSKFSFSITSVQQSVLEQ